MSFKSTLTLIVVQLFLTLIQISFLVPLFGAAYTPALVIAFAFAMFFLNLDNYAFFSAFAGGLIMDLLGFTIIGLSSLVLTAALVVFFYVKRYLFKGWFTNVAAVFLSTFAYWWIILGFSADARNLVAGSFSTLIAALFFYLFLRNFVEYVNRSGYKL